MTGRRIRRRVEYKVYIEYNAGVSRRLCSMRVYILITTRIYFMNLNEQFYFSHGFIWQTDKIAV